jgi:protease I
VLNRNREDISLSDLGSWVERVVRGVAPMLKILMLTGDAGEAQEIYYAKYRLEEEGWQVQIAAPEKRVFLSVVHDFEPGFDTYTEKPGYRVNADLGLDDLKPEEFQGLVLPGGRAPEYLRNRPRAVAIVRHFLETGKPIAANCHGPLLVLAAGPVKGRTMTCYPHLEPDIRAAGGEFVNHEVVVDGSLVTVRGWPDNGPWMREFVRLLKQSTRGD